MTNGVIEFMSIEVASNIRSIPPLQESKNGSLKTA